MRNRSLLAAFLILAGLTLAACSGKSERRHGGSGGRAGGAVSGGSDSGLGGGGTPGGSGGDAGYGGTSNAGEGGSASGEAGTGGAGDGCLGGDECPPDLTCHPELGCAKVCVRETDFIEVWSQADLDEFEGCEVIEGTLRIEASDIETLEALRALRILTDGLGILGSPRLGSLEALVRLEKIGGSLVLINNASIGDLHGLEGVRTLGSDPELHEISLEANPKLSDISAIGNARVTLGALYVSGNEALASLAGLRRFLSLRYATVSGNPMLSNLDVLAELESCEELSIDNNVEMAEVRLDALARVGVFSFTGNNAVEALSLPNLQTATGLTIAANASLREVVVPKLSSVSAALVIQQNPVLASVGTLEALSTVGELSISGNPALPQCMVDALDARLQGCPSAACTGNDESAICP